jgi:hypothetical protein
VPTYCLCVARIDADAHLDDDPFRRASEHIGSRLAAFMGDLKPQAKGEVIPMYRKRWGPAQ